MARDPYSWAAEFASTQHQRAAQEGQQAQNALMQVFETEARRQQPWSDLPVDLAKMRQQYALAGQNQMGLATYKDQLKNGQYAGMGKEGADLGVGIAENLARDLGISLEVAAGFAGNLAAETGDFKHMQELQPMIPGSRGGYGWAQWTGPRRDQFEAYAAQNNLNPASAEANYGFLIHELKNTNEGRVLQRLRNARSPEEAAQIISTVYLRPGIPNMDGRTARARAIYERLTRATTRRFMGDKEYDRRKARNPKDKTAKGRFTYTDEGGKTLEFTLNSDDDTDETDDE